jgi:hypothetical protein
MASIRLAQIFRNESMSPWITGVPLYWMRNSPRETVPIDSVLTPYCAAIARTLAREAGVSDTTARPPHSPKSAYSAGSFADSERRSTCADSPGRSKHDSASVTARPPSLTSWADRTIFSLASLTRHSMSCFSASRSNAGGVPETIP